MKPSIPQGTRDFSAAVLRKRNFILQTIRSVFETYGFEPLETPAMENTETLMGKYGEEGDRLIFKILNSGEYLKKISDDDYNSRSESVITSKISEKALRYDLTVPFARYVVQHQNEIDFPFKRYQIQPVWRADRPQHGRFQEFYQCDADIVGDRSLWQEVEVLALYDKAFSDLKIEGVSLKVNHRKILAGIAGKLGAEERLIDFTIALDKLDKIGKEGVFEELKSKGFNAGALQLLEELLSLQGTASEQLDVLKSILADQPEGIKGIEELEFIFNQFNDNALHSVQLNFDLTLARGLHYYTGMIVEVSAPANIKMGSIGGGGRYDDLTATFGLNNMSGIGISFGFERIYLVMEELHLFPEELLPGTEVLFANFGSLAASTAYSYVSKLRKLNCSSELYPSESKLKKQLGYANQKGIQKVVLIGEEEIKQKTFILKDMKLGNQTTHPLADLISILT